MTSFYRVIDSLEEENHAVRLEHVNVCGTMFGSPGIVSDRRQQEDPECVDHHFDNSVRYYRITTNEEHKQTIHICYPSSWQSNHQLKAAYQSLLNLFLQIA